MASSFEAAARVPSRIQFLYHGYANGLEIGRSNGLGLLPLEDLIANPVNPFFVLATRGCMPSVQTVKV
jgi:hypothetical protein